MGLAVASVFAEADETGEADSENTCEAAEPVVTARGTPCRIACAIAAAAGCAAVGAACSGATVITLGGATIPCSVVVLGGLMVGVAEAEGAARAPFVALALACFGYVVRAMSRVAKQ